MIETKEEQKLEILSKVQRAAKIVDWDQLIINGGPPCFHLDGES